MIIYDLYVIGAIVSDKDRVVWNRNNKYDENMNTLCMTYGNCTDQSSTSINNSIRM